MKIFARKTAEDRIVEAVKEMAATYVSERFDKRAWPAEKIDSPIEIIFMAALSSMIKFGSSEFVEITDTGKPGDAQYDDRTVFVEMQARIIDWRVDFAISIKDPHSTRLKTVVVECDGHEFHERTKEQAARDRSRDRALQTRGYTIFRFTGSELWNKPMECVEQVLDVLTTAYVDFLFEGMK